MISPADCAAIHAALRYLAGTCDGARARDHQGYSQADAYFGHRIAALDSLTDRQTIAAARMLRIYRRQLDPATYEIVCRIAALPMPERLDPAARPAATAPDSAILHPPMPAAADAILGHPGPAAAPPPPPRYTIRVERDGDRLSIVSRYDPALISAIRDRLDGRRWSPDRRAWTAPATELSVAQVAAVAESQGYALSLAPEVAALRQAAAVREAQVAARAAGSVELPADYPLPEGLPPYAHQRAGCAALATAREFGLHWEMGTGKTYAAALDLRYHLDRGDCAAGLIVCPLSLVEVWRRELARVAGLDATIVRGTAAKRQAARSSTATVLIVNYESLRADADVWAAWGAAHPGFWMCLDESTRVKSGRALQTKAAHRIGRLAGWRRILTGTPITNSPLDAYAQYAFLNPALLGHGSFFAFRARYAVMGGYQGHEVVGYRHLDELQARIADYSSRVLKQDCLDLPPKVYAIREVDLSAEARADYRRMADECLIAVATEADEGRTVSAPNILTRLLRLSQITGGALGDDGEIVRRYEAQPKLDELRAILDERNGHGKIIVWCRFLAEIAAVTAALRERGYGPVSFSGSTPASERQTLIDRFQTDPTCRAFVGQSRTGGIGITLTAGDLVVYYSNDYSLETRLQSEDRAHRIGQTRSVTYIDLVARDTIDVAVLAALRAKKSLADIVTGDDLRNIVDGKDVQ